MSSRKTGAIVVAGLLVGLLALWLLFRPSADERATAANDGRSTTGTTTAKGPNRWMPWFLGGGAGGSGAKTPYKGPTIPVYVTVVDLAGEPVAGAEVDAKADREEYDTAGLDDEEYDAYFAAREAENGGETAGGEGGDEWSGHGSAEWDAPPLVPVESGRTDRRGEFVVRLKPDVAVTFHARDGRGREGVSGTLYVYDPAVESEDDWDDDAVRGKRDPSEGPPRLEVRIEIAELSTLSGIVTDDRGRPIAGAEISLTSWSTTEIGDESLVVPSDARGESGEILSGADGRFRVTLRGSGAFDLEAHAKGFQLALEQAIQILPGRETVVNLTLLAAADLAGVVLGPDGEPLADARVLVQGEPQPGTFLSQEASTDEKGEFIVEELAPGRYIVAASHEGMRPTELWNVDAGGAPVTLRLTRGGSVHGEVIARTDALPAIFIAPKIDAEGNYAGDWGEDGFDDPNPPPDQETATWYGDVYLAHVGRGEDDLLPIATGVPRDKERESPSGAMDSRGRYFAQVRLDPQGRGTFDVEGLPGGVYAVTVMVGTATARLDSVRVPDAGRTDVRVSIPDGSGGSIAGTIRRQDELPTSNGTVFLYGGTLPSGLSADVGADGRFNFASVPPGEYRIHAMLTGHSDSDGAERASPKGINPHDESMAAYAPARAVVVPPGGGKVTIDLLAYPANQPMPPSVDDVIVDGEIVDGDIIDPDFTIEIGEGEGEDLPLPDELWTPEVWIEEIDGNLVVTSAPPGPEGARLFGGDRVTSIDGTAVNTTESWEALELLYGAKGSICRITADRPATQSTISVSLVRTRKVGDEGGY